VLFVVFVDFAYGHHARIFCRRILFLIGVGFVPVEDTTNERRNQEYARFCTGARLSEGEQQRQVTVDAFFFQLLGSANTLPGGSQFNQNATVADARIVYGGRGPVAQSNAMGWLSRFFNSALTPF